MSTISEAAASQGLSRATLLYYDRIGLLKPSGRKGNGYRHYTAKDLDRLRLICLYRKTGLPLAGIRELLDKPKRELAAALERQLYDIAKQIEALRARQQVIVELLKNRRLIERPGVMSKAAWVDLLRASGFSEDDMHTWHRDFERTDPEYHQRFLELLSIPAKEITGIRAWSRR
jgi:DNA-binding transcriptional MerR regulator